MAANAMSTAETVAMSLRIPKPLHAAVTKLAERERRSVNAEILTAIEAHVQNAKTKGK